MPRFAEDGEIAAIDDRNILGSCSTHEVPELGMKLWSASRQVEGSQLAVPQNPRDEIHKVRLHHFGTPGPCIDVAMTATLVAAIPEIHLKCFQATSFERGE